MLMLPLCELLSETTKKKELSMKLASFTVTVALSEIFKPDSKTPPFSVKTELEEAYI